jgi:hypothetical protein
VALDKPEHELYTEITWFGFFPGLAQDARAHTILALAAVLQNHPKIN